MTLDEKLQRIKEVGEEIVTEEELKKYLEEGTDLIAYDGFEPSGQIHIAQGILRAINVNKMIQAGFTFKMLVADWHALANNKMGGDLEKIKTVGKYFIEVWKASGMDLDHVEFVWASDMVKDPKYWELVLKVGKSNVLGRFVRTAEMMGRAESLEALTGANIIYSCMQVADIFMLNAKITQLGMDQRKLNMLAREIGPMLGFWKPIVVSHHMLMGLQRVQSSKFKVQNDEEVVKLEPQEEKSVLEAASRSTQDSLGVFTSLRMQRVIQMKMSKSNPDSAIFMTDSPEDVERKINKAYCLEGDISENPILEYCKYILFESFATVEITRPDKFGGTVILNSYADLISQYSSKQIHPQDLKVAVARYLNQLLDPVRQHFAENHEAKELLEKVKSYHVTR